jgi:mono/diheme cytochrome c family protein
MQPATDPMVGMGSAVIPVRRRVTVVALAAGLALALAACKGPWLPVATPADAARAQERWPSTTVDELNHGRKLVVRRCGSCHQPPSPADLVADEWADEVAEMAERSGLRPGEETLMVRYLVAFARDQPIARR